MRKQPRRFFAFLLSLFAMGGAFASSVFASGTGGNMSGSSFNISSLPGTDLTIGGINNTLINASKWLFYFAGLIAVAMIIFYGIRYMTANGDEKTVASAQKGLKYAIIGLVVVLLAWTMITLLGNIIGTSAPTPTYQ
jgi:cytochrome bd-type quinol oxidase subunit 2